MMGNKNAESRDRGGRTKKIAGSLTLTRIQIVSIQHIREPEKSKILEY